MFVFDTSGNEADSKRDAARGAGDYDARSSDLVAWVHSRWRGRILTGVHSFVRSGLPYPSYSSCFAGMFLNWIFVLCIGCLHQSNGDRQSSPSDTSEGWGTQNYVWCCKRTWGPGSLQRSRHHYGPRCPKLSYFFRLLYTFTAALSWSKLHGWMSSCHSSHCLSHTNGHYQDSLAGMNSFWYHSFLLNILCCIHHLCRLSTWMFIYHTL